MIVQSGRIRNHQYTPAIGALTLCLAVAAGPALAQAPDASRFPAKPVRLIVPFPPSGSNDILGRHIAQKLSERWPHQTVVDNRPGADGMIGTELVTRAPADGHTLVIVSTTYSMNPAIHKMPFDPVKALVPIAQIAAGGNLIATHPTFPAKTVKDLIALAKARPGHIRYATSGIGGFNHFGGELFNTMAGVKLAHIPYKGGGPAMIDVMSGQVEVLFSTLIQALPHLRTGKLKGLGIGAAKRFPAMPELPTITESGLPGYECAVWWGILGPAGIPAPIVTRINGEINAILGEPEMARRLGAEAADPVIGPPEAFAKLIMSEMTKWARIAKQAGIKAD
jgi:tripartite-type tricarboxylate transporter receptor subunit TctC